MDLTLFHGPNAGYVLELYERYQRDPQSVDAATRAFFERWTPSEMEKAEVRPPLSPAWERPALGAVEGGLGGEGRSNGASPLDVMHTVGVARLIRYIRELGHLAAQIDPLGGEPPGDLGLRPEIHSVSDDDLRALPAEIVRGPLVEGSSNAQEAVEKLRQAYSGSIGYETDHI